jgi:adenylate kinase
MKIVLIGIQGAGKSTQGNLLSKQLKLPYLSTGHILREMTKEKTRLGRYIKETINAGVLVPDEKMIIIVAEYLLRKEYQKGYILDGFPRTLTQAKKFKNNIDKVIFLKVPDKEALWRIAYRNNILREDESLAAIKKRIELFHKVTTPVINFYRRKNKLIEIDGIKSIKEVNKDILKSLGKQLVANRIKEWKRKQKIILAIAGLPGSGKTEAAKFFSDKGLPVVQFGKIINDYIDKKKSAHDEATHKKIRESLRKKYGKEALAILNEERIKKGLEKGSIVIIDGIRSWEEFLYLQKKFKKTKVVILLLYADKEVRDRRLIKRKRRNNLKGRQRDINELIGTNMGPTMAMADFIIDNNGSLEEFKEKLETIYRKVYFS